MVSYTIGQQFIFVEDVQQKNFAIGKERTGYPHR
jgi:hypothetical protein